MSLDDKPQLIPLPKKPKPPRILAGNTIFLVPNPTTPNERFVDIVAKSFALGVFVGYARVWWHDRLPVVKQNRKASLRKIARMLKAPVRNCTVFGLALGLVNWILETRGYPEGWENRTVRQWVALGGASGFAVGCAAKGFASGAKLGLGYGALFGVTSALLQAQWRSTRKLESSWRKLYTAVYEEPPKGLYDFENEVHIRRGVFPMINDGGLYSQPIVHKVKYFQTVKPLQDPK